VLDDLHWADHPSLLLLQFLARELSSGRLLVMGTYRDVEVSRRHPLSQTLGELTRERLFQRILLRGLNQEDVGRFIELVSAFSPTPALVESVHRQTEGNPLFVTEVVRLLVQEEELAPEGARDRESWSVRIPEGVREVIGRRLDRLTDRCNQTLTVAAVVGREFSLDQLQPLVEDLTEERLLEVLEEALQARVIEELPRAAGQYQFTHALIQETLTQELTTTRRVRLHGRIAETLEQLYGDDVETHAAELAHHFAEAQTVLGTEKLVRYSLLAGQRALGTYAYEEALSHFQRGLQAKSVPLEGTEPVLDAEAAALLFGFGRAQMTGERHEIPGAISNLTRAFDYYAKVGDVGQAVAVAETRLPSNAGLLVGASQLVSRALELVPPDSSAAGRLLVSSIRVVGLQEGDYERAHDMFQQAVAIARREHDPALEAWALVAAGGVDCFHLRLETMLENNFLAIPLATDAGVIGANQQANMLVAYGLMLRGDHEAANQYFTKAIELAQGLGDRYWLGVTLWLPQLMAQLKGDYELAGQLSERGLEVVERGPRLLATRTLLEHELGNMEEADIFMERLLRVMGSTPPSPSWEHAFPAIVIPLVARTNGTSNLLDTAQVATQTVLASSQCTPIISQVARTGLAVQAISQEDVRAGNEQYREMIANPGQIWTVPISADRVLGLLRHLTGHLDKGAEHFEDALKFCRQRGY
ncbi:MAG: hypothetical protein ACE5Q6_25035, partial [Dehalococcoidia bacterium]